MKAALLLLTVVMTTGLSHAYVCPHNYCENVTCSGSPTAETCKGDLVPNSSFCGCCPTCYQYLQNGAPCLPQAASNPTTVHKFVCESGTRCIRGVCVPYTFIV